MAWGFLDWARGRKYQPDPDALSLPLDASENQLREMSLLLLDNKRAWDAYKLLDEQKQRARSILESLLREDKRFKSMSDMLTGWGRPRFDVVLTILFKWHSEYAVDEAITLVDSPDANLRAIAARLLASTGEYRFASILKQLTNDAVSDVREAFGTGISDVLDYGRQHDRKFDDELGLALFDFMKDCALRTDHGPGLRFAQVLFRIDRERAIREIASVDKLAIGRNWLRDLLLTLQKEAIRLPTSHVKSLIDDAMAIFNRTDFRRSDDSGVTWLMPVLLCLAAEDDPSWTWELIRSLRNHRQAEAREAAQEARERLSPDPIRVVLASYKSSGGLDGMPSQHRVVYFVWILEAEVNNGGWLQWIANSSGQYARETVHALAEIGAHDCEKRVSQLITILGPDGYSPDQQKRMAAIDRMEIENARLPGEKMSEISPLLFDYAEKHRHMFDGPSPNRFL